MENRNILVTGATGFIGQRLVRKLVLQGNNVKCLVRRTSDVSVLEQFDCQIVYGDTVEEPDSVANALDNVRTVYHLAALTHTVYSRDLIRINEQGTRNVLDACSGMEAPPTAVIVSSLAAVGPSNGSQLHDEEGTRNPVSFYGRSKAASELASFEYAGRVPISIVRPPIVLGGGDRQGLEMFRIIDRSGWHFVPGFFNRVYSVIHVDDLVDALIHVANQGKRLTPSSHSRGIYFASSPETFTYSQLGRMIGQALGRRRTRVLKIAKPVMWTVAMINEVKARLSQSAQFVNIDKFHEAFAGSWACSSEKIESEVGFRITTTMLERLKQTAKWYRQHGWLKPSPGDFEKEATIHSGQIPAPNFPIAPSEAARVSQSHPSEPATHADHWSEKTTSESERASYSSNTELMEG